MTKSTKTKIQFAEVAHHLDQQVDLFDMQRTDSLKQLHRIRAAKQNYMRREHDRMSVKLGATHPRVTAFAEKQARNDNLIRDLSLEVGRVDSQIREVEKDCWVLHGRVYSEDLMVYAGLSVSLKDSKDKLLLGPARTDKKGYFKLVCDAEKEATDIKRENVQIKEKYLYLHVSESDGTPAHSEPLMIIPQLGCAAYQDIMLPENTITRGGGPKPKAVKKKIRKKVKKKGTRQD